MKTLRCVLCAALAAVLALVLFAPTALAQDTDDPDEKTITIEIKDGERRVIVDGEELTGEEADAYLREHRLHHDGPHGLRGFQMIVPEDSFMDVPGVDFRKRFGQPFAYYFDDEDGGMALEGFLPRAMDGLHGMLAPHSMPGRAEIARMDAESRRLAREARQAEGAERERLEAELREKLDEIFARKQALRAEHIEQMRERVEALEEEQQERAAARNEIIERRLKMLLGERHKYDW